jgi:hypothetical protein
MLSEGGVLIIVEFGFDLRKLVGFLFEGGGYSGLVVEDLAVLLRGLGLAELAELDVAVIEIAATLLHQ